MINILSERKSYHIPSNLEAYREKVEPYIVSLSNYMLGKERTFGVRLACEEAVSNAIKHGNQKDETKKVKIEIKTDDSTENKLEIIVEDEGNGFDRDKIPDCTLEENLGLPLGRGICLMESYSNKIIYKGNRIILIFYKR